MERYASQLRRLVVIVYAVHASFSANLQLVDRHASSYTYVHTFISRVTKAFHQWSRFFIYSVTRHSLSHELSSIMDVTTTNTSTYQYDCMCIYIVCPSVCLSVSPAHFSSIIIYIYVDI